MVINFLLECVITTVNVIKSTFFKSKWRLWHCHVKRNQCKHVLWSESPSGNHAEL